MEAQRELTRLPAAIPRHGWRLEAVVPDLNGDGLIDFADYLEFLNHFDVGC